MFKTLDKHLGFEYKNTIRKTLAGFFISRWQPSYARKEARGDCQTRYLLSRNRGMASFGLPPTGWARGLRFNRPEV